MSDKIYLINANINMNSMDPDSNSIVSKKLMRLVWAQDEREALNKLQIAISKIANEEKYNYSLSEIIVSEALQ